MICNVVIVCLDLLQVVSPIHGPQSHGEGGLYFSDGRRKVDYVLVYHQRRHSSARAPASTADRLSVISNGNFAVTVGSDAAAAGRGGEIPGREAAVVVEVFVEIGGGGEDDAAESADHEMQLIRQEFEANLSEAGLEIEIDGEVSVCWNVYVFCMRTKFPLIYSNA